MEIPANLVIRKMEDELARLKESLVDSGGNGSASAAAYREHAQALKTYCDLLLDTGSSRLQAPPKVQHASLEDVERRMSEGLANKKTDLGLGNSGVDSSSRGKRMNDSRSGTGTAADSKNSEPIYDESDLPNSDSLFDF